MSMLNGNIKIGNVVGFCGGDIESLNVNIGDKIFCINDKKKRKSTWGNTSSYSKDKLINITKGNIYFVLNIKKNKFVRSIKIMGDKNKCCWVNPVRFKANEEFIINECRNQTLTKILNENIIEL